MIFIPLTLLTMLLAAVALAQDDAVGSLQAVALNALAASARARTNAKSRIPLADVKDLKNADALQSANVPNYIRALAQSTKAAPQYANLVQTFVFGGTVPPETKMAMGLRIAQLYDSSYLFAQTSRWLRASVRGRELLANWDNRRSYNPSEVKALVYAEKLTNDIHGVTDNDFAETRGAFNDSQIVELTMNVSFFHHFLPIVEPLDLPIEH